MISPRIPVPMGPRKSRMPTGGARASGVCARGPWPRAKSVGRGRLLEPWESVGTGRVDGLGGVGN